MKIKFSKQIVFCCLFLALCASAFSERTLAQQQVVDKTVAAVSDGVRSELITYSDLLWQLALEPNAELQSPRSSDLNDVLRRVTDQRLIALEAERLPTITPTDEEIQKEIRRILAAFPSPAVFEGRLRTVGFASIDDPNFRRIVEQRVAIEKYLDFRFRSFVVITPEEEDRFYKDVYAPRFRRQNPGVVVPTLDETRTRINQELMEEKIEADIQRFLEETRNRAAITTLNPI